jgi:hypothetical protein
MHSRLLLILGGLTCLVVIMLFLCTRFPRQQIILEEKIEYPLYNGDEWKLYRLGDIIKVFTRGNMNHPDYKKLVSDTITQFPHSLGALYGARAKKPFDYDVLFSIMKTPQFVKDNSPPGTCTLHLRLGDTVSRPSYSRPLEYYTTCIVPLLRQHKIDTLTIVTGSHTQENLKESSRYVDNVKTIVQQVVKNITVRAGHSPDSDFIFMATSHIFVASGGGYSRVIKNIVQRRGGIVLECTSM